MVHTTVISRGVVASLALLAAVGMSACSANRTPSSAAPAGGAATSRATAAVPAATTPAPTLSATPAGATRGIQNLLVTRTIRSELIAAFVRHKGISPSDVAGTYPGSVYYAHDPATNAYWAVAQFESSSTAPNNVLVGFQDGGNFGLFRKIGAAPWQVQVKTSPPACTEPQFFPRAVLMAWSLPTSTPTPSATNSFHC